MKAMPLAFEEFQGKGTLDFSASSSSSSDSLRPPQKQQEENWLIISNTKKEEEGYCYVGSEPTSVLDTRRSPSPPTSSSTLSSSFGGNNGGGGGGGGGGASTDTTGLAPLPNVSLSLDNTEKCGLGSMEDWETVLSGSPSQEQSILRLIMGDVDDPSMGLNKILQPGNGSHQDLDFNSNFGVIDQPGLGFEPLGGNIDPSSLHGSVSSPPQSFPYSTAANISPVSLPLSVFQQNHPNIEALDEKPQIFNPQMVVNQNQAQFTQNPAFFLPLPYAQLQEHHLLSPPPPKRMNFGPQGNPLQKHPFSDPGQNELFLRRQQQQHHHQIQMLHQRQQHPIGVLSPATATKQKMASDEMANQQLQQAIIDQIFKAAELIETGNSVLAQGILARLNHQLFSPIGKPFQRAAFYFKEALQLLLQMNSNNNQNPSSTTMSGYSIIFKIGAYKCFSEISPILQFANFTCNQSFLESFDGFDKIHIVDFDIGYGGQWASLMQEFVHRNEGPPSLKITAFASSPSIANDDLELSFTQENLRNFANDLKIPFEIEILSLESLNSGKWPMPVQRSENEAIAVNLPIASFSNCPSTLPLVLRFVKQLSPKIVVSSDRSSDRAEVPFPHHIIHAFQSYTGLLESLDAVNVNLDALQKIERFLIHPCIEKIVLGRQRCNERLQPWKSLFLQSGFSPVAFSNFAESQAECLVQRTPVRGFHVEKRQSSLVLCWQRKELISVTAWRC